MLILEKIDPSAKLLGGAGLHIGAFLKCQGSKPLLPGQMQPLAAVGHFIAFAVHLDNKDTRFLSKPTHNILYFHVNGMYKKIVEMLTDTLLNFHCPINRCRLLQELTGILLPFACHVKISTGRWFSSVPISERAYTGQPVSVRFLV